MANGILDLMSALRTREAAALSYGARRLASLGTGDAATRVPGDLELLEDDLVYTDHHLDHLYFHTREVEGGRELEVHKVVRLLVLDFLPREAREQMTLLQKMRKALKGLYEAEVDFLALVCGIFEPHLGILQCYGVQGLGEDREEARARASSGIAAVEGVMANFEQSRLRPVTVDMADWMRAALQEMRFALVGIGQPDPRDNPRGMVDVRQSAMTDELQLQQNELLYRGMARLRQEFINVLMAVRVDGEQIYRLQVRNARESSRWASMVEGTKGISLMISIPTIISGIVSDGAGTSYSRGTGYTEGDTVGQAEGTAHTDSHGTGSVDGVAHSQGHTEGFATSEGQAHTVGQSTTESHGRVVSVVGSQGGADADTASSFQSTTEGEFHSDTEGQAHTSGDSWSHTTSASASQGGSAGESFSHNLSGSTSMSGGVSLGLNAQGGVSASEGISMGQSQEASWGVTETQSDTHGGFESSTHSLSHTDGVSQSESEGTGQAHSDVANWSQALGISTSRSVSHTSSVAASRMQSATESYAESEADTESHATSRFQSEADARSYVDSRAHTVSQARGVSQGQTLVRAAGGGLGMGIAPALVASKSYRWEDHVARLARDITEKLNLMLDEASAEGAFLVDNYYLVRTTQGARALKALIAQAYHGVDTVTPVQARLALPGEETEYIRHHARTFTPTTRRERVPGLLEMYRDTTLLPLERLAALCSPGCFEEGVALTIQERIPPYALPTDMRGDVVLGNLVSYETGEVTEARCRLGREQLSNIGFFSDTGFGKSVVATWLEQEFWREWQMRVVVLDYGLGHRTLMNVIPPQYYDQYGLYQGSPRPIRWNFLQVGRRIPPDVQLDATVEVFCTAGRMGQRQYGFMWEELRRLYIDHGVLTSDPMVLEPEDNHPACIKGPVSEEAKRAIRLSFVSDGERRQLEAHRVARGEPPLSADPIRVKALSSQERQVLAIERSKGVDVCMWFDALQMRHDEMSSKNITDRTALSGVLHRMRPFRHGQLAEMYGRGEGSIAVEDLAYPHGVVVLEGGTMAEQARATVLGLLAWHIYNDAVFRRQETVGKLNSEMHRTFLVFEEANKIISGVAAGPAVDDPMPMTSSIYSTMFRDARKYNFVLGVIGQSPSELPRDIVSSCNILLAGRLKNPDDRDVVIPAMGRSEKGFHYLDYMNHLERLEIAKFVCVVGLQKDKKFVEPMLIQTLMLEAEEPSNEDIEAHFGA